MGWFGSVVSAYLNIQFLYIQWRMYGIYKYVINSGALSTYIRYDWILSINYGIKVTLQYPCEVCGF